MVVFGLVLAVAWPYSVIVPDATFRRLSTPARNRANLWRRLALVLLALLGLALLAVAALAVVPPPTGGLASHPNPAAGYAEATRRVAALQAQESTGFNPLCKTQLLTHGQKAARAIAFIPGYTNCPYEFRLLSQQFYDLGYNVLLVPAPYHGLADLMTSALSRLTAEGASRARCVAAARAAWPCWVSAPTAPPSPAPKRSPAGSPRPSATLPYGCCPIPAGSTRTTNRKRWRGC